MDIMSGSLPAGQKMTVSGKEIVKSGSGSNVKFSLVSGDWLFTVSGPSLYEDIMLVMAASITSVDR